MDSSLQPTSHSQEAGSQEPVGITWRAAALSLGLAVLFGYIIPIVDMKMRNTFLGATHLPPGAIAVLLILLLVLNPVLYAVMKRPARRYYLLVLAAVLGAAAYGEHAKAIAQNNPLWTLLFWALVAFTGLLVLSFLLGRRPLSRNETLTVYISCLFSCLAPGHGAENVFVVNLIGPFYYATRENKWLGFLDGVHHYIAPWMTPALSRGHGYENNPAAHEIVGNWFLGTQTGQVPWGAWLVPLLVWGFFIFVLYVMMACLCSMFRMQWAEREALTFPLLRLPLELTQDVDRPSVGPLSGFFSNPMMWTGFGIAVFIQLMRGLHMYFPDVPDFPLEIDTTRMFSEAPWSQMGWTPIRVWPVVVGISYLLTSEVSFSFFFFFWFIKFQLVGAYMLGFNPATLPNAIGAVGGAYKGFTFYQQIGVYFAYVGIVLWTGREHLWHIARRSFGRVKATPAEKNEAMSYPMAFWGFIGSFALLTAWTVAAGVSPQLALILWGLYIVTIIALTRIIAEAGILFVQQGWAPLGMLGQITNSGAHNWLLSEKSVAAASMFQGALMTDLRGFLMPSFIQGFKLAHDRKIALKPLVVLMMACSVIALMLGVYMNVKLGYSPQGGLGLDGWYSGAASTQPATITDQLIHGLRDASWFNTVWLGLGILLTYGMMLARSRFAWFPLHPIGMLLAQSYPMGQLWFSLFLGWLAKVTITRFGGQDNYKKVLPAFLGLMLGDVTMMLFWLAVDGWMGHVGHKLMPG